MTSHVSFAFRASAGLHAAAIAAGLAWTDWNSPVHVHLVRGEVVLEASFATPPVTQQELPPVEFSPSETAASAQPVELPPVEAEPVETPLGRQTERVELLASADLPKLPAELEACDCPAHEAPAATPKRPPATAPPQQVARPAPIPRERTEATPKFTATTAVSLPASAAIAGLDVDEPPRKIATNPPPPYPADAYQRGLQGRVVLEVQISAAGTVDSLHVLQTSGLASFDQAALDTVRTWRFEPARRGGQNVAAVVNVPVRFELRAR